MPEETLFETESYQSRTDVAAYLRAFAAKLESGGGVTLSAGTESVTVTVPDTVEFEVEVEREGKAGESGELSIEFELEWDEDAVGGSGDGADTALFVRSANSMNLFDSRIREVVVKPSKPENLIYY